MRNTNSQWNYPQLISVPGSFQLAIGGSPLVARTLYQRGLTSPDQARGFLDPAFYRPCSPSELPGLASGARRIIEAIRNKEQILIWGDFDVDGQTSTALLVSSLTDLGARVAHYIPNRATESHGVSVAVLAQKLKDLEPRLIVTCDTGIDAVDAVQLANHAGTDVLITDHHQLPPVLPEAQAIINPNTLPEDHGLYNLPGVGVAYKLVEEIYGHFSEDPSHLLDLVALGIVSDVAIQTGDTRYLLQKGLTRLRTSPRLGLLEIYRLNNIELSNITEDHIGYVIGPRLNALGRLDDANSSVDFFTTEDPAQASYLARQLEELNKKRQELTEEIFLDAEKMISAFPELVEEYPVLVLQGSSQWNPGVIGIVASRLVERYHKPVIMLSQDGDQARGSARSIPGVSISDLISASHDHLTSYGGHPMAAGMNLPLENVSRFRRALAANYQELVGNEEPEYSIDIDAEIYFQDINEDFINDFHRLAPFGAGNPKLTFSTRGVFTGDNQIKLIGRNGVHRKITFSDANGDYRDFLWWNSKDLPVPDMPLDIAYSLSLTTYRDQPQIQATLHHLRQSPETPIYLPDQSQIQVIDMRKNPDPLSDLISNYPTSNAIVWAENMEPEGLPSKTRSNLSSADTLILWTTPPNQFLLNKIIKVVSPKQIILIGVDPGINSLDDLVQSLIGLIKHLQRTAKPFDISRFAEVLALPEEIIEVGIKWIHHHGDLDLEHISEGRIKSGPGENLPGFTDIDLTLKHLLREIIAYRTIFKNTHIRAIL